MATEENDHFCGKATNHKIGIRKGMLLKSECVWCHSGSVPRYEFAELIIPLTHLIAFCI